LYKKQGKVALEVAWLSNSYAVFPVAERLYRQSWLLRLPLPLLRRLQSPLPRLLLWLHRLKLLLVSLTRHLVVASGQQGVVY
tara:strand:- start:396 stop:641 length:246 start_codon:yes stop_codon:yes gene_type:complete